MSDKSSKDFFLSIFSLDLQPSLVLRAIFFALVIPGTLNAAFGIDRQVFLETMALVSTIFDTYARSIFLVFQIIQIDFSEYETIIGQFYLFIVFPIVLTTTPAAKVRSFRNRITRLFAIPLIGLLSTLVLILFLRLALLMTGLVSSSVGWLMQNAPVLSFIFFNAGLFMIIIAIGYMLKYASLFFLFIVVHFFQSQPYQNYVIVVLTTFSFFLTIELMRLGTSFNRWICQIVLMISPEKESIITACMKFI